MDKQRILDYVEKMMLDDSINSNIVDLKSISRSSTIVIAASNSANAIKEQADYVCTGTNDNIIIQKAIDTIPAIGGTVTFSEGSYYISGQIDFKSKSNLTFIGHNATFIRAASMATSIFVNSTPVLGTGRATSATYGIGKREVALTNVTNFTVGEAVTVTELNNTTYQHMDIIEAINTTSKTVTLQRGLKWGFTSGVSSVTPITGISKNITMIGLQFKDESFVTTDHDTIVDLKYMRGLRLFDLKFDNISAFGCIRTSYSIDLIMDRISINNVIHSTLGYGICLSYGTTGVTISNSVINGTRHAVTGDRFYDVAHVNIIANGITTLANTAQSFDSHQYAKDLTYTNCISNGAFGGLNIRGQRVTVNNFICNSTSFSAIGMDTTARDITINNFQINNPAAWGENVTAPIIQLLADDVIFTNFKVVMDSSAYSNTINVIEITDCNNIILNNFMIDDRSQTEFVTGINTNGTNTRLFITNGLINTYGSGSAIVLNANTSLSKVYDIVALQSIVNNGTNNVIQS